MRGYGTDTAHGTYSLRGGLLATWPFPHFRLRYHFNPRFDTVGEPM